MADRGEGVPAPNPNQWQQEQNQQHQQQIQDPAGQQQQQVVHLSWYNLKPEFSGKSDEDAEVCLLCSNDWMNTHSFVDAVKVQRFSLTLLEARLWYRSLEPINIDWPELQNCLGNEIQR